MLGILSISVPVKSVALGHKDPEFITPIVKLLLRQRYRLRRRGRAMEADIIAQKINDIICENRSTSLRKLDKATTKQMWAAVKKTRTGNDILLQNPNAVNRYFEKIASKNIYDRKELDIYRHTWDYCDLTLLLILRLKDY